DDDEIEKAQERFSGSSKAQDSEIQTPPTQTSGATVGKRRKRFAVVGALVVLLLVVGGIVAAFGPSSTATPGGYPLAVQQNFLSGCEEGKTSNSSACHCSLAEIEANYSVSDVERIEEAHKHGAPLPTRFTQISQECVAPKGNWDMEARDKFVSS